MAALSAAEPVATVTTMAHPGMVDTVIVAGQVRKCGGHLLGIDDDQARAVVTQSRDYLMRT